MKRLFLLSIFFFNALLSYTQSVAVNTDGSVADTSAMLDIKSTIKGILIPRMGTAERQAIVTPATGLLVFDNDALSFWFFNGANWIELGGGGAAGSWAVNGIDIYNANAGNVGIGLLSPLAPLHIKKDLEALRIEGTSPYISFLNDAGTDPKAFMQNTGDNFYLGTSTGNAAGITQFYSDNSPKMTLLPNGNIGIGTEIPADKLTVATPGASYGLTHTDGITTVGTWIGTDAFFPGGWVGTKSNHQLNFFTAGGVSKMTIFPNGNVVVGDNTVTPVGKFTVKTTNNTDGISHLGDNGNILKTIMGGTSAGIGTFSHTNMRIFSGGSSRILIAEATGNVGIGTDNPTYKLSVVGNIRCTEVVVETGWADYVFHDNYKLPSLATVEKFIKQHKHLPNIPSAKEVEQKGLQLGDVQKRMMEKIEELTLYVIELNKKITKLEAENSLKQ